MGEVYRASDLELGFDVALKLLHSVGGADRLRLKSEFRALADVVHPNLVDLHDLFIDDRSAFFTMELVSGRDFIGYVADTEGRVRSAQALRRLEDCGRQLAMALHALHTGGKLHRDVKPSNVMVTHAGRAVLLDFGLAAAFGEVERDVTAPLLAGTILYMAPEQAWGTGLSPAADWYAFGATLYEAITGNVPVDGNPAEVMQKKRNFRASSLIEQGFELSPELDALLMALLDPNPKMRPDAERILRALGGELLSMPPSLPAVASARQMALVGREHELQQLEQIVNETVGGTPRLVHVVGPSGIGKSSLLRALGTRLPEGTRMLSSRCHPQEAVAFNAIDGLIDDLSQRLPAEATVHSLTLEPEQRAALVRVFPTLGPAFEAVAPLASLPDVSVQGLRQLAFAGLCRLFVGLATDGPLLLWIDDVQWADADSGALLGALLKIQAKCGVVLALSYRDTDSEASPCLRVLAQLGEGDSPSPATSTLQLRALGVPECWALVEQIAGQSGHRTRAHVERLIEQSGGVPFFVCELARYLAGRTHSDADSDLGVERLIGLRMAALPQECQLVLDVLSVAGSPLSQDVVLRAAGLPDAQRGLLTNLERLSVLRTTDAARRTSEVYHHRIREQVLTTMPRDKRQLYHRAIAVALLSTMSPNLLSALDHFEAAGDIESVKRYVTRAAESAAQVLAFDRAAQLYQRALELDSRDLSAYELRQRLAVALASAGRGKEAGEAFLAAGDKLLESPGADARLLLRLRQLAAEQFIQTGHHEQGVRALTTVLSELDIPFPRSRGEAIRKATLLRMTSFFRSMTPPERQPEPLDELGLRRFDALWSAAQRLSMVDHTMTTYASIRCAIDSIRLGEPLRCMRALSTEAANLSTVPAKPFQRRADALMHSAHQMEKRQTTVYDSALLRATVGVVQAFRGQFRGSLESMDWASASIKRESRGSHFELALWQVYAITALSHLGELKEVVVRVNAALDEAKQRDDRFAMRNVSFGRATLGWLAQDRVEHAIKQADLALTWAPREYTTQHYQHFVSSIHSLLYEGRGIAAWERAVAEWPLLKANYFLALAFVRDELLELRGRAALGAAAELRRDGRAATSGGLTQSQLLDEAQRCAETISKHELVPCRAWGGYLQSLVAHHRGDSDAAVGGLRTALLAFEGNEMRLYRETARAVLGSLLGGEEGEGLREQSLDWLRGQAVLAPARLLEMLAPGVAVSL